MVFGRALFDCVCLGYWLMPAHSKALRSYHLHVFHLIFESAALHPGAILTMCYGVMVLKASWG